MSRGFRHKLDAALVQPDSHMSLTDCVLLWSDGTLQVFELLSVLEVSNELSSLIVNEP